MRALARGGAHELVRPRSAWLSPVTRIRRRFGVDALRTAADLRHPATLPTGSAELDAVLVQGGLPRGHLVVLRAQPSAGMHSLAFSLMVAAQQHGDLILYLDLPHTFDAEAAVTVGVDPAELVLARPESSDEALAILHAVAASGEWGMVVVDALTDMVASADGARRFDQALRRTLPVLARSRTVLVGLLDAAAPAARAIGSGSALAYAATTVLEVARVGFVEQAGLFTTATVVTGIRSRVTVLTQPGRLDTPSVDLAFPLVGA